nr:hypothetical protein [Tanacetum cinerariifolium]
MLWVFPLHSLEPQKGGWTDFPQEPLILGISLRRILSKGIVRHPRPLSSLKTFVTSSRKVNIFYNVLGTMNRQMLDSHRPIPGMKPAQALMRYEEVKGERACDSSGMLTLRKNSSRHGMPSQ